MGITQFDPIYIEDSTFYAASNIFSLLFRLDSQTGGVFPDLATSWEWEDDNEVFVALESREVTADDVVYSIERHINAEGAAPPADLRASFGSVEAIDDYTVRLSLNGPNAL